MTPDNSYEPKEIVIDIGETIPTDEERIAMWKEINKRDDVNFECSKCVWGIQDMERGVPLYCDCFYGRQHIMGQPPPWYIKVAATIIETLRGWFKN